jgi:hypothetical protein
MLLVSCLTDNSLDDTIFVHDANDHNLPAYTEWGYNSFGANYERQYFVATNDYVPCKIVQKDGYINFMLIGNLNPSGINDNYKYGKFVLSISFPYADALKNYSDLVALNKYVVDLTAQNCTVTWTVGEAEPTTIAVREGELNFKRAQLLRVDGEIDRVILSGTFYIKYLNNEIPESFDNGRFDLGLYKDYVSL